MTKLALEAQQSQVRHAHGEENPVQVVDLMLQNPRVKTLGQALHGLAVHAAIINLLHVMGAKDAYIARQFQMQAMMLGIRGGIIGGAAAALVLLILTSMAAGIDVALLPSSPLSPSQWPMLIIVPVAAIVIAMATARVTVLRTLARMP